ncbi:cysteine dioxygenase [Trichonephila clavipes]|nr:cysteine dioxygenase [Trichonephila clavipes]
MAELDYRSCFGAGQDVEVQKRMLKVPKIDTLDDLIRELRSAFSTDHVNVERVQDLMAAYKSNPREWIKYAKFDRHRRPVVHILLTAAYNSECLTWHTSFESDFNGEPYLLQMNRDSVQIMRELGAQSHPSRPKKRVAIEEV